MMGGSDVVGQGRHTTTHSALAWGGEGRGGEEVR